MTRTRIRHAIIGAVTLGGLTTPVVSSGQAPSLTAPATDTSALFHGKTSDPYRLALRAYVWGYPLVRAAQLRQNITLPPAPDSGRPAPPLSAPLNRIGHARALATPDMKQGVAPNNDTLYSLAWLDTNDGPFVLETPDFGTRYYTFQMGQADTSTTQSPGQRTHGSHLPPIFIQGPEQHESVPAGMMPVRSTQRYMMIAGRILVKGAGDLPAVHALQDRIVLRRYADYVAKRQVAAPVGAQRPLIDTASTAPPSLRFLDMLGNLLRDWRVTPTDAGLVASFAQIGLTPGEGFRPDRLSASQRDALSRGVAAGEKAVRAETLTLGTRVNGWGINYAGSQFGSDYLLRAAVAMDQIYVLPTDEALYPNARTDGSGRELDGRKSYVLRFAKARLPPVKSFWSATMYFAKGLLVPNPIARYSIGDRTPGLVYQRDGSLELVLQHDRPKDSTANWLPTPDAPFMLMLRLYNPETAVLDRRWAPPAITKTATR